MQRNQLSLGHFVGTGTVGQACKSTASPERLATSLQTFCAFGDPSEAAVEASISASVVGSALPCQGVPWQLAEVASAFVFASEATVTSGPTAAVVAAASASAFVAAVAAVEGTAAVAVAALEPAAGRTASSSVSGDGVFSSFDRLFVALVAAVEVEEASASEVAVIAAVVDARTAGR